MAPRRPPGPITPRAVPPDRPTEPLPDLPPDLPADEIVVGTPALELEDFRSLRRWVVILGALALAASVVAVVALFLPSTLEPSPQSESNATDISVLQEETRRIDEDVRRLRQRVGGSASRSVVSELQRRVRRVEAETARALERQTDVTEAAVRRDRQVDALERRIDALEARRNRR